jgi:hypothetical protein
MSEGLHPQEQQPLYPQDRRHSDPFRFWAVRITLVVSITLSLGYLGLWLWVALKHYN